MARPGNRGRRALCGGIVVVLGLAGATAARAEPLPLEEFSPAFLGMYRKVMDIEDEIRRHARHYGVDFDLARAVCMYEYVIGVGYYRTVLKQHDAALRHHASRLRVTSVRAGEDWSTVAGRVAISVWELRLHSPFLAGRRLEVGQRLAYPPESRGDLVEPGPGGAAYRMRDGDNYIKLALMLGIDVEALRAENGLWQTQIVPAGVVLRIPLSIDRDAIVRAALSDRAADPTRPAVVVADRESDSNGAPITVANPRAERTMGTSATRTVPRAARAAAVRAASAGVAYRVKPGDTLTGIARRHQTTVAVLRQTNGLRGTALRVGQVLRIPAARPHA